eukprot:EG_transcript_17012
MVEPLGSALAPQGAGFGVVTREADSEACPKLGTLEQRRCLKYCSEKWKRSQEKGGQRIGQAGQDSVGPLGLAEDMHGWVIKLRDVRGCEGGWVGPWQQNLKRCMVVRRMTHWGGRMHKPGLEKNA